MLTPFAYYKDENGNIQINGKQADIVQEIYQLYLSGKSLGSIVDILRAKSILSPTGKSKWTAQAIDNLLSNPKYIPIIKAITYSQVQLEKSRRSNKADNNTRKTTRYNSQNVLSGLLVCGCCGKNYRRITHKGGDVVWRCADRVENGNKAKCKNLHTISEDEIKKIICDYLGIDKFDEGLVKESFEKIEITVDSTNVYLKTEQLFGIC